MNLFRSSPQKPNQVLEQCIPSIMISKIAPQTQRLSTTLKSLIPLPNHHLQSSSFLKLANLHLPIRHFHPLNMSSQSSPLPPQDSSTPIKTVKVTIKGRVQGVFYRDWTVQNATELGLKGWVRNRRDGSVEALFSGSENKVGEMQERCRRGPPSAMVTGVNVSPCDEDPGAGFERRPTV